MTNETIADIAAEKRRIAKEVRDYASNGDYWDRKKANETAEDLEEEADRLEAAHKRECGDCATLRNALEDVLEKIDRWRTDGSMEHWQYSQLFDIADAALATTSSQNTQEAK